MRHLFLTKLAMANLRVHKIRAALTISAIALSVSLVVAVTSGYASIHAAASLMMAQFLGTTDVEITRRDDLHGGISADLLAQLRADPAVSRADGRLEFVGPVFHSNGMTAPGRFNIIGVERPGDIRVQALRLEKGKWFDQSDTTEAVVDQVALERLNAKIGDEFILPVVDRRARLRIVGVVHKPRVIAAAVQTVYVPLHTLQKMVQPGNTPTLSRVLIDLRLGTDGPAFVARWGERLKPVDPNLQVRLANEKRKAMDDNLSGLHALSYLGGSISMLAAMFIIFSALSMGVAERQRSLAMLRAIGAFRGQLGQLVVCEGLLLAGAGVILGIPLGILWMKLLAWKFHQFFTAGAAIGLGGILFAAGGSIVTALAASLLPAMTAMRSSPLDAMTPLAHPPRPGRIALCAAIGLLLTMVDPLILFSPLPRSVKFYGHFTVGLACLMLGFFLLAPLVVRIVELIIGPVVALLLGLRFALLRQQLSTGIWRAAGTGAALMVGLAILIVTQTQGTSVLQSWKLPDKFPDMFIFSFNPLGPADQEKLRQVPGIRKSEFMPIAIASPQFGSNMFALAGAAILPDATMFFGIDPDIGFKLMELDFRDGNAVDAQRLLKLGQHVIVTQEYRQLQNLGVGSKLALKTNKGTTEFTIAGVVWSPGIDVIASNYDLGRQLDQRTAASVFGTLDDAREYFGVQSIHLFAANVEGSMPRDKLIQNARYLFGALGVDASDARSLKFSIQQTFFRLLTLVSVLAYASMAVASMGVTNTIMASVRTRRWQFGILRSIGVTRGQLLRLVIAEAILLGIVGLALGLAAGFHLVMDARQEWKVMVGFTMPLVVPWNTIVTGMGVIMLISILASLWPAIHVARSEPLSLLQAGRAAM